MSTVNPTRPQTEVPTIIVERVPIMSKITKVAILAITALVSYLFLSQAAGLLLTGAAALALFMSSYSNRKVRTYTPQEVERPLPERMVAMGAVQVFPRVPTFQEWQELQGVGQPHHDRPSNVRRQNEAAAAERRRQIERLERERQGAQSQPAAVSRERVGTAALPYIPTRQQPGTRRAAPPPPTRNPDSQRPRETVGIAQSAAIPTRQQAANPTAAPPPPPRNLNPQPPREQVGTAALVYIPTRQQAANPAAAPAVLPRNLNPQATREPVGIAQSAAMPAGQQAQAEQVPLAAPSRNPDSQQSREPVGQREPRTPAPNRAPDGQGNATTTPGTAYILFG